MEEDNNELFEQQVQGTMLFLEQKTKREVAEFIVHLTNSLDALNKNNAKLAKAYRDFATKKEKTEP